MVRYLQENAKNGSEYLKLIWSGTFAIFNTKPLWFWSRIGSRVKISHYIQPSNLSSALFYKYVIGSVGTSHSFLLHSRGSVYIRDYSRFFVHICTRVYPTMDKLWFEPCIDFFWRLEKYILSSLNWFVLFCYFFFF